MEERERERGVRRSEVKCGFLTSVFLISNKTKKSRVNIFAAHSWLYLVYCLCL